MQEVNTVLGPVDTADLGFTLCHEHVIVGSPGIRHTYPELMDWQGIVEEGVRRLTEAYDEGVRTIIDVTPHELGRDISILEEVSRRSRVQIIAATGTYVDIPRLLWHTDPDRIAALYIREIEQGIEGTGVRAGVIKVANNNRELTPEEVTVLRAAARASKTTGAPITTHSRPVEHGGESQMEVFDEEGVEPSRICIGHSNETTDVEYLRRLLRRGVYLGLDVYPSHRTPPDWEERTVIAKELIDEGFVDQLMFSHDWSIKLPPDDSWGSTSEEHNRSNPDGYLFITRRVLPKLRELGVTAEQIRVVMEDNPRRFLTLPS